ncbi:MAG: hypothetical protein GC181_06120 [Bacteroidetes bacterium]|nr:hypothetical protein [Bacteroidota bacterium]
MRPVVLTLLIMFSVLQVEARKERLEILDKANVTPEELTEHAILKYQEAEKYRYTDRKRALDAAEDAVKIAEKAKNYRIAFESSYLLGLINQDKRSVLQPKAAITAFEKAAVFAEMSGDKNGLMSTYKRLAEEYAAINQSQTALNYYKKYTDLEENKIHLKAQELSRSLEKTQKDVADKNERIGNLEVQNSNTKALLDSVSKEKLAADLEITTKKYNEEKLKLEQERLGRMLSDEKNKRNRLIAGVIGIALLLAFMLFAFMQNRKANRKLAAQNEEIEREREKSDELLLNILPGPVAEELKENGKTIPRNYENVTVLFTDFQSFTRIAEQLSPIALVNEIDYCFREFDQIISKYHIEKIKTIGDAYMCASGLPVPYDRHVFEILDAALEIRDLMNRLAEERERQGKLYFRMRIGIHCGPLVAGVVGSKKFVYDVWGDTVNTAARMEQNGEPGKINVSKTVYDLARNHYEFEARGVVEAKNKGQLEMYFLTGRKKNIQKAASKSMHDISTS